MAESNTRRVGAGILAVLCVGLAVVGTATAAGGAVGQVRRSASSGADHQRNAMVYSLVIRELVTQESAGFAKPRFGIVYVIDGIVKGAADSQASAADLQPGKPFDRDTKQRLRKVLRDLPPLKFIRDRGSVIADRDHQPHTMNNGVVVTVGPIRGTAAGVQAGGSSYVGAMDATWQTYVVTRHHAGWKVDGTIGPRSIA